MREIYLLIDQMEKHVKEADAIEGTTEQLVHLAAVARAFSSMLSGAKREAMRGG